MRNNINEVAQTIADEISKFNKNTKADDEFHASLGLTKRESEARRLAAWFLLKIEKMTTDSNPNNEFNKLRDELIKLAIEIAGK